MQSGAVLARASIETPVADSYVEAYKAFVFKLLSELPEYRLTIGVEARIANIQEQATTGADDYAKALAALYNRTTRPRSIICGKRSARRRSASWASAGRRTAMSRRFHASEAHHAMPERCRSRSRRTRP